VRAGKPAAFVYDFGGLKMGNRASKKILKAETNREVEEKSITEEAVDELRKLLRSSDPKLKIRAISLILRHTEKLKRKASDDIDYIGIVEEILKENEQKS
jgi:hypothetical protein